MFLTEAEILDTPLSLNYTCQYFEKNKKNLEQFFQENQQKKFTILGCGSSYMLAKSTASLFASLPGTSANAIAAGDYIVDPLFWYETVKGSIVLLLSRSGKTSEMVWALKHIKEAHGCPAVSITTEDGNDLMPLCDLNLTLNWCHDEVPDQSGYLQPGRPGLLSGSAVAPYKRFRRSCQDFFAL